MTGAESQRNALLDVVTLEQPLGPSEAEALLNRGQTVFRELYDETNLAHCSVRTENPFFIVGRKGAGKTAFLAGAAIADNADMTLIGSEDVYMEVNKLSLRYTERNGPIGADSLVHVWEVLLFHAAMLAVVRSRRLPNSVDRERLWSYLGAFGDPSDMTVDTLVAAVGAEITNALLVAPQRLSFRAACWSIDLDRGAFSDAASCVRKILDGPGDKAVYVVVDNLEDLHKKLDAYADVVTALFRVASRSVIKDAKLPFRTRFAFPAELLPRLRVLAANPEKDFRKRLIIRWTAGELIVVAGNRLRTFLDLYFRATPKLLGLPRQHDPRDRDAAELTLRALLPAEVKNGLGGVEDPVAYLLRHTQLLPRHLIMILNEIMSMAVGGVTSSDVPRATCQQVVSGVHDVERVIVDGILTTYSYTYPQIGTALEIIKNHIGVVEPVSRLHKIFNDASVARAGLTFDEFLDAALAIGAFGVVIDGDEHSRYVEGEFSYTFAGDVRPVEDRDRVCVHPLFVSRLFDRRSIARMAQAGCRAVYPYGSDPEHVHHDV